MKVIEQTRGRGEDGGDAAGDRAPGAVPHREAAGGAADVRDCGDLVDELPLAQSTVSEHLKVLKDAGIVRGTIEGPNTCYCLEPEALGWLKREFGALSEACC